MTALITITHLLQMMMWQYPLTVIRLYLNVLDNDTSRDGNSLTISTITRSPERGTAVIASNGTTIEYTPQRRLSWF